MSPSGAAEVCDKYLFGQVKAGRLGDQQKKTEHKKGYYNPVLIAGKKKLNYTS